MDWAGVGAGLATVDFERFNPSANPGRFRRLRARAAHRQQLSVLAIALFVGLSGLFGLRSRISGLSWATPSVPGAIAAGAERRPRLAMRLVRLIVDLPSVSRCCLAGCLGFSGRGDIAFSADGSFD